MVAYADPSDLYDHGLPTGLSFPSRLVESADPTGDTLELNGHSLALDKAIEFTTDDGGVLPAPLGVGTVYYAKPVDGSDSRLQIAATTGGAAINLTTAGTFPFRLVRSLDGVIEGAIAHWSSVVGRKLIGHVLPMGATVPSEVRSSVAKLAIRSVLRATMTSGYQSLIDEANAIEKSIDEMSANGSTLRDPDETEGANMATGASPPCTSRASRVIP